MLWRLGLMRTAWGFSTTARQMLPGLETPDLCFTVRPSLSIEFGGEGAVSITTRFIIVPPDFKSEPEAALVPSPISNPVYGIARLS
jgi:hypothetical protein